jgi:hypothetical protein
MAPGTAGRRYPQVDSFHRIQTPEKKSWLPRLKFVSQTMDKKFKNCDVTIALDSHVTVCESNLGARLDAFHANEKNILGANVEQAPQKPWYASPFKYFLQDRGGTYDSHCHKYLPHNFAVAFRGGSQATRDIMQAWWRKMNGAHGDDQKPLMKAIESERFPFTRLSESFAFALKSVDKGRFGMWPRFSYLIPAGEPVTLVHSYDPPRVPNRGEQTFCEYINKDRSEARMVWQERMGKFYEVLTTYAECAERLRNYEPRLCDEMGWPKGRDKEAAAAAEKKKAEKEKQEKQEKAAEEEKKKRAAEAKKAEEEKKKAEVEAKYKAMEEEDKKMAKAALAELAAEEAAEAAAKAAKLKPKPPSPPPPPPPATAATPAAPAPAPAPPKDEGIADSALDAAIDSAMKEQEAESESGNVI